MDPSFLAGEEEFQAGSGYESLNQFTIGSPAFLSGLDICIVEFS